MNFNYYNLGYVERGSVVEVTLQGSATNVRLMDTSDFNSYKAGRSHRYIGGLATRSPVRLQVPHSGTWYVTVDMQGLRGTVRSAVRVIPGAALRPLPTINEAPLRSVPSLVRDSGDAAVPPVDTPDGRTFDVFISHASWPEYELDGLVTRAVSGEKVLLPIWHDNEARSDWLFSVACGSTCPQHDDPYRRGDRRRDCGCDP